MAPTCNSNPVVRHKVVRLRLGSDGAMAPTPAKGCRLYVFRLGRNRVVPIPSASDVSPRRQHAFQVLDDYAPLGAQVACNGTFFNDDAPPFHPLGPLIGANWADSDRFAKYKISGALGFGRWGVVVSRNSTGTSLHIQGDRQSVGSQALTRLGGGFLFIDRGEYVHGGKDILAEMAKSGLPIKSSAALYSEYKTKFVALNQGTSWSIGSKRDPRNGIGVTRRGNWYMFAVLAADPNRDTGLDEGYRIVDLAVELQTRFGFTQAVIFDGSSPFQLARLGTNGKAFYKEHGVTRQASPTAMMLVTPHQIRLKTIGADAGFPERASGTIEIDVPPPGTNTLDITFEIVNMRLFGDVHDVHLDINAGAIRRRQTIYWGAQATESVTFSLDRNQVKHLATPLKLQVRTTDFTRYTIDCLEFELRFRGGRRWALIIDDSGSMSNNDPNFAALTTVRRISRSLFGTDTETVWADVLRFADSSLSLTGGMQQDLSTVVAALSLSNFSHSGGTDITGAIAASIQGFGAPNPWEERGIVLITDGEDENFDHGIIDRAQQMGIRVFPIGLGAGVQVSVLDEIAQGTGGTYSQATDVAELALVTGQLDSIVSSHELMMSLQLAAGSQARVVTAGNDVRINLAALAGGMELRQAFLRIPSGDTVSLAQIQADPGLVPGVSVAVDHADTGSGGGISNIQVSIDESGSDPAAYQVWVDGADIAVTVTEASPAGSDYTLSLAGLPDRPEYPADTDEISVNLEWRSNGALSNPVNVEAVLIGGGAVHPMDLSHVAAGVYQASIVPADAGLAPGTYRLLASGWEQAGSHQRTVQRTLSVFEELDVDLDPLPQRMVAEEPYRHVLRVEGNEPGLDVKITLDDSKTLLSANLRFRGVSDGMSLYEGVLDMDTAHATRHAEIAIEARKSHQLARTSGAVEVLGSRGVWIASHKDIAAFDASMARKGTIANSGRVRVLDQCMDARNSTLWRAERNLVGNVVDEQIHLRNYSRQGRLLGEFQAIGEDLFNIAACAEYLMTVEAVVENGKRTGKLVIYNESVGGVLATHPATNGLLLPMGAADVIYFDRIPQIPNYNKVMRVTGIGTPVELSQRVPHARGTIHRLPGDTLGIWYGHGQPMRLLQDQSQLLTKRLNGRAVASDDTGFWLVTGTATVRRYEFDPDSGSYRVTPVNVPGPPYLWEGFTTSRPAAATYAFNNRRTKRVMAIHGLTPTEFDFPAVVNAVLTNQTPASEYPPMPA